MPIPPCWCCMGTHWRRDHDDLTGFQTFSIALRMCTGGGTCRRYRYILTNHFAHAGAGAGGVLESTPGE